MAYFDYIDPNNSHANVANASELLADATEVNTSNQLYYAMKQSWMSELRDAYDARELFMRIGILNVIRPNVYISLTPVEILRRVGFKVDDSINFDRTSWLPSVMSQIAEEQADYFVSMTATLKRLI